MCESKVELYIYDLSRGMAATLSPMLIGKRIEGIWHTAVVAYGREYFFGSQGVESCTPGTTALGAPLQVTLLGETQVPYFVFIDYLNGLGESTWAGSSYSLFNHNCNNFSQEIAQFLCGVSIPKYILDLPNEVLNSSLGPAIPLLIAQLEKSARPIAEERSRSRDHSPDLEQLNSQIEEVRYRSHLLEERRKTIKEKLARKDRKKEKKRKKLLREGGPIPVDLEDMADTEMNGGEAPDATPPEATPLEPVDIEEEERLEEEERKKSREPPVIYRDLVDVKAEFDSFSGLLAGKLNEEESKSLEELRQYVIDDEGSWALGDNFLNFIGRLLHDREIPPEIRVKTLNILSAAALKDDIILILHQDRRDHVLMNYAFEIDRRTPEEQESLALFFANMFENLSSSEWLMYISEWTYNNQQTSNIRVTTKVAVHSLLSGSQILQERGTAIIHNLACKEVKSVVFDDVAVELTMALLQFFSTSPSEEHLFRCLKALAKFVKVSSQEVSQLIQMIGPDPRSFKGASERVDSLVDEISIKLR